MIAVARRKKVLKGPWTRYPDAKSLLFVLERCSACCTLIDRVSLKHDVGLRRGTDLLAFKRPKNVHYVPTSKLTPPLLLCRRPTPNRSFTLMMQTGAFLQLTLALVAIASRANILLSEVKAVLEISWSAGYTALHILYVSCIHLFSPRLAHSIDII